MRFAALATDYDGTLAELGEIKPETLEGLQRFRRSGRRTILVTGRTLASLLSVLPHTSEFDYIVAENGATLYDPQSGSEEVIAEKPPASFLPRLKEKQVWPLETGRAIIATDETQKQAVLDAIQELGLELHIIFNKGALMILPSGANKATGLQVALDRMGLSAHSVAGIGDAENDHAFLAACEFSAAVANALPTLKERVHLVTRGECGAGVVELTDEIVASDLCRHAVWSGQPVCIGRDEMGKDVHLQAASVNLIAGTSGAGKSTITTAFLEGLAAAKYQFCVLDAEGDYETLVQAVVVGDPQRVPKPADIGKALQQPSRNAVGNLLAVELDQRPAHLRSVLAELQNMRDRLARPHCIVIDEAHHFLRAGDPPDGNAFTKDVWGAALITLRPELLPVQILKQVRTLIVGGQDSSKTIAAFAQAAGIPTPEFAQTPLQPGQMLAWVPGTPDCVIFCPASTSAVRVRHRRKYAEGELHADRSFYFHGR